MSGTSKANINYKDRYRVKNPRRGEHLKPWQWKPGECGNKDGRPNGSISLVARLKAHLKEHPEDIKAIIESLVKEGINGNLIATKEMLDRVDGKVVETHKIEGELPIKLIFVPAQQLLNNKVEVIEGEVKEITEGKDART